MKTMAIRLEDDVHAQLSVLAQLDGTTVADLLRQAVEDLIRRKAGEGDLAARAKAALAEIDQEAAVRRAAIQTLFGSPTETTVAQVPAVAAAPTKPPTSRRRSPES
jgi:predicted transcriptional regulator